MVNKVRAMTGEIAARPDRLATRALSQVQIAATAF